MLADVKARRFATEFFGQWLGFYQFDRYRGVDPERFPEFDDRLRSALYDEAINFSAVFVALGFVLILLGIASDNKHGLF